MVDFLCVLLGGVGLTSIVVDSEFFANWKSNFSDRTKVLEAASKNGCWVGLRKKIFYMLNCYQCAGFWIGMVLGVAFHPMDVAWYLRPMEWIACAGVVSYAAQVGMALFNYLNVQYGSDK